VFAKLRRDFIEAVRQPPKRIRQVPCALPPFIGMFGQRLLDDAIHARDPSGCRREIGGGLSFKIEPMTLADVSPVNGLVPVAIS
jgi:hypothetical protein